MIIIINRQKITGIQWQKNDLLQETERERVRVSKRERETNKIKRERKGASERERVREREREREIGLSYLAACNALQKVII